MAKSNSFSNTWWGRQWINILESFGWANRLERGRRYARNGSVLEFHIEPGKITAKVQGSRSTPYKVTIKVAKLTKKEWQAVLKHLSTKALYAAKLLSGDMPEDIAAIFQEVGISLLPADDSEIDARCSCPDFAVPCKHIAAVHYIVAEELDKDPFLVFKLRGMEKEEVLDRLLKFDDKKRKSRDDSNNISTQPKPSTSLFSGTTTSAFAKENNPAIAFSLEDFWSGKPLPVSSPPAAPSIHATAFADTKNAFWSKDFPLAQIMQAIYRGSGKM
ncbi:MAG: hypothetical protein GXW90_07945 [Tepidanaerobacter acetatoxydans]|jgi:uncharacterized Zn finger protein|uniref:SWIM zinc finger family protein n=1 Tax=Tepidanaerobacter TaxID=499228 RepID=UPI000A7856DA|nr:MULTISPECIES: SWIM zinc finger family protein [Tepidanaerobacter]NLU10844.1 hypothetical protein [Tepidanaerobacter acetatoxydans]